MLPSLCQKRCKTHWNASTVDELHPFPERALTHTNSRYNGVEVMPAHFPHRIKGSTYLRLLAAGQRVPRVWTVNKQKSKLSHLNTYHCPALDSDCESDEVFVATSSPQTSSQSASQHESHSRQSCMHNMNFLAWTVVEDADADKESKEQHWCTSVELDRHRRDLHYAVPRSSQEQSYRVKNSAKWNELKCSANYITPEEHVRRHNEEMHKEKIERRRAEEEDDLSPYRLGEKPVVYKMSNIDEWIKLNPVTVTEQQMQLMNKLRENKFSRFANKKGSCANKS